MKFIITCDCGKHTFETDREGLEYWANNVGKLLHYPAETQFDVTITVKVEEADLRAEGLIH